MRGRRTSYRRTHQAHGFAPSRSVPDSPTDGKAATSKEAEQSSRSAVEVFDGPTRTPRDVHATTAAEAAWTFARRSAGLLNELSPSGPSPSFTLCVARGRA